MRNRRKLDPPQYFAGWSFIVRRWRRRKTPVDRRGFLSQYSGDTQRHPDRRGGQGPGISYRWYYQSCLLWATFDRAGRPRRKSPRHSRYLRSYRGGDRGWLDGTVRVEGDRAGMASRRRWRRSYWMRAGSRRAITLLKPLSAAISIGTGGPFGAEGPIIATGGAFGSLTGQWMHISPGGAEDRAGGWRMCGDGGDLRKSIGGGFAGGYGARVIRILAAVGDPGGVWLV